MCTVVTSAASSHPEDAAMLWVTIGGKCPFIIIIVHSSSYYYYYYVIDFEQVGVMEMYDNSSNNY